MTKFKEDILPITKEDIVRDKNNDLSEEEWRKRCPGYGSGYKDLGGIYCDHCTYLINDNNEYCPNNR